MIAVMLKIIGAGHVRILVFKGVHKAVLINYLPGLVVNKIRLISKR
tara:strand:+ start:12962 stop:13099 length:138 start_codon:yes stop_codon:yes gene_type:complete